MGCQESEPDRSDLDRLIAVNAHLDVVAAHLESFVSELSVLALSHGGTLSDQGAGDTLGSIELRIPVERWPGAFADLRARPEAAGGEQIWGQDITDQIAELERLLETASGEEAARLQAMLEFRLDRIERATIVVRIRRPG